MHNNETYYKDQLLNFINDDLSAGEVEELCAFIEASPDTYSTLLELPDVQQRLKELTLKDLEEAFPSNLTEKMRGRLMSAIDVKEREDKEDKAVLITMAEKGESVSLHGSARKFKWQWIAAAVLIFVFAGSYLLVTFKKQPVETIVNTTASTQDIAPGKQGAILTLADGTQILLDSLGNGVVAEQSGTKVELKDGQLLYNTAAKQEGAIVYNSMITPKGRQFRLVLPDGTNVWLNAASSIKYPTAFMGKERNVEITGEAYFEVAKNKDKPFHVMVKGMQVEVLGTHFNINAYNDETNIKTTLLEGSVKINTSSKSNAVLKPGEQAQVIDDKVSLVRHADIDQVMAWKNGIFNFDHADLPAVLRQLSRWYDIDVRYEGSIPVREFEGKLPRDLNLSQVLKILSAMEVKYSMEGKTLVVGK